MKNDDYDHGMNGKYVLVRCLGAGVHAGFLEHVSGQVAVLTRSRRLFSWRVKQGAFLSSVAEKGIKHKFSKIGEEQRKIMLCDVCEVALCSAEAQESLVNSPAYDP